MSQLTILSAKYANADNTAALVVTQEQGTIAISQQDTPDLWSLLSGVQVDAFEDPNPNATIFIQISTLEKLQTPRRLREAMLGDQDSIDFLRIIDEQIADLRSQL